jgi:hypothetical protein
MRDRPDPDTPISNATYVADASSFGFKQGYDLRHYAQDITHLLSTSFPEVLKTVYVSTTQLKASFQRPKHGRSAMHRPILVQFGTF